MTTLFCRKYLYYFRIHDEYLADLLPYKKDQFIILCPYTKMGRFTLAFHLSNNCLTLWQVISNN